MTADSYAYFTGQPLRGKIARTVEADGGVMFDVDADGRILGAEVLGGTDWAAALAGLAMAGRLRIDR